MTYISVESAIWCFRKRKIILISLCKRSGPDRSLSLGATPCYFAVALHSSDFFGFMRVDDRMMWQIPLKLVSLCDHCCYCCRSIWGTCCSLLRSEVTVQKFLVSSSTIRHTTSSAFAIHWPMTRSPAIETDRTEHVLVVQLASLIKISCNSRWSAAHLWMDTLNSLVL